MAIKGLKPVVEIMFSDFLLLLLIKLLIMLENSTRCITKSKFMSEY